MLQIRILAFQLAVTLALLSGAAPKARAQAETVLYSFLGGADGGDPEGGVVLDAKGNLYGTTEAGGGAQDGTFFKLTPAGVKKILRNFTGEPLDGEGPIGNILSVGQTFYGATEVGGAHRGFLCEGYGCGAVYELTSSGKEKVLYSFTGGSDGFLPMSGVVQDSQGNLYGTTLYGGNGTGCTGNDWGCGTVYKVTPQGEEVVLHQFSDGADGGLPWGGLAIDESGNVYGTTQRGGDLSLCSGVGCGTVFQIAPDGTLTVLHAFEGCPTDGAYPGGNLILDAKGNLYGTTQGGGTIGCKSYGGTVFEVTAAGREIVLYNFQGGSDGEAPGAGLVRDKKGNLYGTTYLGGGFLGCQDGQITCGTVFEVGPKRTETVLYRFTGGADGGQPMNASLLLDAKGNLYGTTQAGGDPTCNCGVIFKVTP